MHAWEKKGLIYCPDGRYDWNRSHAQVPVVHKVNDKVLRVYYSSRNVNNQSNTSYIDVAADNPSIVLYEHDKPILQHGSIGTFDDCGIMPACVTTHNDVVYLYYIGWTTKGTVPYQNSIGLALSYDEGKTFSKYSEGPVLGQSVMEPFFTGTICVMNEANIWRAWYLSCIGWKIIDGKPESFYNIKYAESADGIHWKCDGKVAIDLKNEDEGGLASATVIKEGNKYKMWFSFRGGKDFRSNINNSYRIGYAESGDGINWERMDDRAGINISDNGWDSFMIAYPYVIANDNKLLMFYNGNGFGKTGFGYATSDMMKQ